MKFVGKLVCTGLFLLLLYTAPAFAQFEVNPDHFDNMVNQSPPKPFVASNPKAARQHLGTGAAALQKLHARESQARSARTSPEKTQVARVQRHGVREVPLSTKISVSVQPKRQTVQVAEGTRE